MPKAKSFPSLGKRLWAAVLSYHMGYAGVDRVLKEDPDFEPDSSWNDLGTKLQRLMVNNIHIPVPKDVSKLIH